VIVFNSCYPLFLLESDLLPHRSRIRVGPFRGANACNWLITHSASYGADVDDAQNHSEGIPENADLGTLDVSPIDHDLANTVAKDQGGYPEHLAPRDLEARMASW
jgi:hypothetical protein